MVLSNDTITQINYIKDIEFEYNIKLFLFIFFIITAIIALYIANKGDYETESRSIFNYFLFAYGWLVIFFLPLYLFFLQRLMPLTQILNYIAVFYQIIFSGFLVIGLLYLIEAGLMYFFGLSIVDKKPTRRVQGDYRQVEREVDK